MVSFRNEEQLAAYNDLLKLSNFANKFCATKPSSGMVSGKVLGLGKKRPSAYKNKSAVIDTKRPILT